MGRRRAGRWSCIIRFIIFDGTGDRFKICAPCYIHSFFLSRCVFGCASFLSFLTVISFPLSFIPPIFRPCCLLPTLLLLSVQFYIYILSVPCSLFFSLFFYCQLVLSTFLAQSNTHIANNFNTRTAFRWCHQRCDARSVVMSRG